MMLVILRLLSGASGVSSALMVALAAFGDWIWFVTSLPLVVSLLATLVIYARQHGRLQWAADRRTSGHSFSSRSR